MKSILGLLFWVVLITANSTFSQNLLLKNGHIVNPATQEITNGHLVIQDEIIKYILKKAPETFEGEVIDLSGKWNKETMQALIVAANEHKIKTVIHIGSWQDAACAPF